jgi:hypothetical protein
VDAVSRIANSITYSGLDSAYEFGKLNGTSLCRAKVASMINKAGRIVIPSVFSAQAAVRNSATNILEKSTCPGFGLCGNVNDGSDEDVWPITAFSVGFKIRVVFLVLKF